LIREKLVNKVQLICFATIFFGTSSAFGISDDFNDNLRGSYWSLLEDSHSTLRLVEQNNRLEVIADHSLSAGTDAIYLSNGSNGFKVSTSEDFQLFIDYSYTGAASLGLGDAISLVLGVGRDLDGTDSAAIGVVLGGLPGLTLRSSVAAYRTDDDQTTEFIGAAPPSSTMFVAYDASEDTLLLGLTIGGYFTLDDTVKEKWKADSLWVSFGARGRGAALNSGNASLDNFRLAAGDMYPVPEPSTMLLFGSGIVGLMAARRKKQKI
jgi:hypothetical protein